MENRHFLLKDVFPDLAEEIRQVFVYYKRIELYEQVDKLEIVSLCECGEINCGSFYTVTPPNEEEEYNVEGFIISSGKALVEIYEGKIGYIEIMPSQYGQEIHNKLLELL